MTCLHAAKKCTTYVIKMSFNLQKKREATKGSKWFDMKAPEMSEELRNELEILQMRSELDPKRFYKRSEMKTLPKYFEVRREQLLLRTVS
jgi:hypothetical protein